jgi:predicted enzyme related to lactoylglutathione lyase
MRAGTALAALLLCGCATMTLQKEPRMARMDYLELPATDVAASRAFYEQAFGWSMTQFGPTYAATTTGDTDVGLDADPKERVAAPLGVIRVADLEAALASVTRAGGSIIRPIFAFPGGRRFHFRDPGGNELAVYQPSAE